MSDFSISYIENLPPATREDILPHGRWVLFGVCAALFVMSMFYRMSSAVISEDLIRDLGLDSRGLGLVGGVFFYAFALVQIPLGLFLDRAGARGTMITLNLIGILGAVLFSFSHGVSGAIIGRCLLGIGMAANLMGSLKLFTNWFDLRRFATLSGLLVSLGTIGAMGATSPLALLAQTLGWRNSFLVLAGVHGLMVLALVIWVPESPPKKYSESRQSISSTRATGRPGRPSSLGILFRNGDYWAISWSIFLRYGAYASIQALWAGPFIMTCLGFSPVQTGNMLLMLSIGFIIGAPAGGFASDRILRSRKWAVVLGTACSAVTILIWSQWPTRDAAVLFLGALLFVNGFFTGFNQISYAHIRELMPSHMSGTAMTGINVFTMAGGGVFVHGLGEVIARLETGPGDECNMYRIALLLCAAAAAASSLIYILTRDAPDAVKAEGKDR